MFQDLGFVVGIFFQLNRKILLLDFSLDSFAQCLFLSPGRQDGIFDQLLSDGAGTLLPFEAGLYGGYAGTENPHDVDTVVLVKTLILDGDKGVCQIGGNLIHRNGDTVGVLGDQLRHLVSLAVINKGRVSGGSCILQCDGRCRIYNPLENPQSGADADNPDCNDA